jgi:hypothetical protein
MQVSPRGGTTHRNERIPVMAYEDILERLTGEEYTIKERSLNDAPVYSYECLLCGSEGGVHKTSNAAVDAYAPHYARHHA